MSSFSKGNTDTIKVKHFCYITYQSPTLPLSGQGGAYRIYGIIYFIITILFGFKNVYPVDHDLFYVTGINKIEFAVKQASHILGDTAEYAVHHY